MTDAFSDRSSSCPSVREYEGETAGRAPRPPVLTAASALSSSDVRQRADDQVADHVHRLLAHAARRDGGRADADAAGDHGRVLVERDRVLVDGDARLAERRLRDLAGEALREDVHQHQVIVGAAADQPEAAAGEHAGEPRGVGHDLPLVGGERRLGRFLEAHGLGGDRRARAARPGRRGRPRLSTSFAYALAAEHHARPRAAQRLVRGRRDEVGMRHRARVDAGGDEPRDVRHVGHQQRAASSAIWRNRAKSNTRG